MYNIKDLYPSRTETKLEMFPRLDPVLHTNHHAPWSGPLTENQLASFEQNGFLFIESLFSDSEILALVTELHRLATEKRPRNTPGVILEPESKEVRTVFQIHKPEISDLFSQLVRDPRLLERAQQLLASQVYIHQSRINYKPGFTGKGFNWHSDFETWHAEDGMPRMRAVSCSIILTENNEFNGPLMLIPGSHKYFVPCIGATPEDHYKTSLQFQQYGVPDRQSLARLIHEGGIQAPKGPAGSLLLFECNTLHGSNANMSPVPRSNVFFVYNSVRNIPRAPYASRRPRPHFLCERQDHTPLQTRG